CWGRGGREGGGRDGRGPVGVVGGSTGKDSAFALHAVREGGEVEVVGLLTTLTSGHGRVSMHGVREDLLDRQAAAVGLPCRKVWIASAGANADYERAVGHAIDAARAGGITRVGFGYLVPRDVS